MNKHARNLITILEASGYNVSIFMPIEKAYFAEKRIGDKMESRIYIYDSHAVYYDKNQNVILETNWGYGR